jgi:hypothetical protein
MSARQTKNGVWNLVRGQEAEGWAQREGQEQGVPATVVARRDIASFAITGRQLQTISEGNFLAMNH